MFRLALRNLVAYAPRFIATALAVIIGIGFLSAGLMLTGAMKNALTGSVDAQYANVDLAVTPNSGLEQLSAGISPAELATIRATPGVEAAAGELAQGVRVLDADGDARTSRTQGRAWISDEQLSRVRVEAGRAPESDREVAVDAGTASDLDLQVGDTLVLATPSGRLEREVVGVTTFGDRDAVDDGGTISFTVDDALDVLGAGGSGFAEVLVRTAGDTDAVRDALRAELPVTLDVVTGADLRASKQALTVGIVDLLRPVLNGFAWVALFVAGFVIFNTFSVVVTQRTRELALVRAVGGTPGQVRRSMLFEGVAVGLIASLMGIAVGALLSIGVTRLLGVFGVKLPGAGVSITPLLIVGCTLAGTVVTAISVMVPAFRAGRTRPVEAMREVAVDRSGSSTVRAVIGGAALVIGLVTLLGVRFGAAPAWALAPGALLLFIGVLVGGPLLARAFARVLTPPLQRIGLSSRLAADNSVRNPRRTATTANALVIGLFLVTVVTTSGEAFKSWAVGELDKLSASDFIVGSSGAPISPELLGDIEGTAGVRQSAPVRTAAVTGTDGLTSVLSGADVVRLQQTTGLEVAQGSLDDVAAGRGAAVIDVAGLIGDGGTTTGPGGGPGTIGSTGPTVGSTIEIAAPDGTQRSIPVAATLTARLDSLALGVLVNEATFTELAGDQPVNQVFIRTEPGAAEQVGLRLDDLTRDYTGIEVVPGNFLGQVVGQILDFLIGAVNALLGISVLIALVGIVNTMTLSVFERRAELGMVRALGMTRQQVSRMIRVEAALIGLLGTIVGVGCGLLIGWVIVGTISNGSVPLALNWARLGLIIAVGLLAGVLAAVFPARRAVRVDMLEAMRSA